MGRPLILAAFAALAAGAVHAQMPAELSTLLGVKVAPGQWREYRNVGGGRLYDGRDTKVSYFRTEHLAIGDYQWIEFGSVGQKPQETSRVLVSLADPAEPPLRTLVEVDAPINPATLPGCDPLEHPRTQFRLIGDETVRVPAGTFLTTVFAYRSLGVEHKAYVSARDPKGIVMIETPTLRTELVAAGGGAESRLHGQPLYDGPAACPRSTQDEYKFNALIGCLQERVIAAAALGGERDYDSVWQRTTRLCGVNPSAGIIGGLKGSLEHTFETQWVAPRQTGASDGR
jgi:hypothetical protein